MSNDLLLLILIIIIGLLNFAAMMYESRRHYDAEATLWDGLHNQWDQSVRLWGAVGKKEDRHE